MLLGTLVLEGQGTGRAGHRVPAHGLGTVVTRALRVAAVTVTLELPRCAVLAVAGPAAFSVLSANLAQRHEHTPGLVELCALLALVMQPP